MNDPVGQLAARLPGPWHAIVGIPRGGLIVAALLGYELDVRSVGAFTIEYRRGDGAPVVGRVVCQPCQPDRVGNRIVVVEDGTDTGTLLDFARRWLTGQHGARVTTAALWVRGDSGYRPDVWLEEVDVLPSARSLIGTHR